jgi:ribonuclease HI
MRSSKVKHVKDAGGGHAIVRSIIGPPVGKQKHVIFVDGSGAGPDGRAGFAWHEPATGKRSVEWKEHLTNNEAEYRAILAAVLAFPKGSELEIRCDSQLVVNQLKGEWEVYEPRLWDLKADIEKEIFNRCLVVQVIWIPRSQNRADKLLRQKPRSSVG